MVPFLILFGDCCNFHLLVSTFIFMSNDTLYAFSHSNSKVKHVMPLHLKWQNKWSSLSVIQNITNKNITVLFSHHDLCHRNLITLGYIQPNAVTLPSSIYVLQPASNTTNEQVPSGSTSHTREVNSLMHRSAQDAWIANCHDTIMASFVRQWWNIPLYPVMMMITLVWCERFCCENVTQLTSKFNCNGVVQN